MSKTFNFDELIVKEKGMEKKKDGRGAKRKYTHQQIEQVIALKKDGCKQKDIEIKTGVPIASQCYYLMQEKKGEIAEKVEVFKSIGCEEYLKRAQADLESYKNNIEKYRECKAEMEKTEKAICNHQESV
jgi:DNA-binding transcriptional MerR regulator